MIWVELVRWWETGRLCLPTGVPGEVYTRLARFIDVVVLSDCWR